MSLVFPEKSERLSKSRLTWGCYNGTPLYDQVILVANILQIIWNSFYKKKSKFTIYVLSAIEVFLKRSLKQNFDRRNLVTPPPAQLATDYKIFPWDMLCKRTAAIKYKKWPITPGSWPPPGCVAGWAGCSDSKWCYLTETVLWKYLFLYSFFKDLIG